VAKARKQDAKRQLSWEGLLESVAASHAKLVLETVSGARVVLIAEEEFLRLGPGPAEPDTAATDRLTKREIGILSLVAGGKSGTQVAAELSLAPNTVAQHLVSVRRKLGVTTTAAAIEVAQRSNLF
jgi:DNA-binding NarL/FixJ family response regulator